MGKAGESSGSGDDRAAMQTTAAVRDVSEYQLFVDAYREWHGQSAAEESLETQFGHYLRSGVVPEFVRHYLRSYQNRHPEQITAYQRELRRGERLRRIAFWAVVLIVLLALAL